MAIVMNPTTARRVSNADTIAFNDDMRSIVGKWLKGLEFGGFAPNWKLQLLQELHAKGNGEEFSSLSLWLTVPDSWRDSEAPRLFWEIWDILALKAA